MSDQQEWLYYRVYVASIAEIRDLVEQVVGPAVRRFTAEDPSLRWFFLQYVDLVGLQLRLRLRGTPSRLARYEEELDDSFRRALDVLGAADGPRGPLAAHRMVTKRLYEPEHDKFGGPAGVALAERLMQCGSEAALVCAAPQLRPLRISLAAAHTKLMVAGLPAAMRTSFLHQYAWYWSGRGRRDAPFGRTLPGLSPGDPAAIRRTAALRTQIDRVLQVAALRDALTGYVDEFWLRVRRAGLPRPDYLTAFHHIHLMNNRLGVVPGEEMQIARLLWLEGLREPRVAATAGPAA
ncbi:MULTISPECIES: thiopeptide-type bacteriocin biosynthesis protein [unclassified Streptomyces]|uniref:thiopeptide-type bacteriocin biosynthesis protein n=1 Tax=unclassified Streptomyces TaxID=2593676 RepID=UPI001BEA236E|nr:MULTISPECIES: thiopeptide-type bacteriocin biosynthesis protein [unclassified Streptomyces]MBT2405453.1 thiopeptide-type bacteriocin biosynthesis protein [Streptomyces sp. ISL-21]MBT2608060.1 thiopeptide-type bacteriocin biosynthesis protein [Streptomyces sp. ISL-87]